MPKLPSGRNIVVDFAPALDLAERADRECDASLLLFVEDGSVFAGLVDLHEAEFRPDIPREELEAFHTRRGVRYAILHHTGLNLADVFSGRSGWSQEDVRALEHFMCRKHMLKEIRSLLDLLQDFRSMLTDRAIHEPFLEMALPRWGLARAD